MGLRVRDFSFCRGRPPPSNLDSELASSSVKPFTRDSSSQPPSLIHHPFWLVLARFVTRATLHTTSCLEDSAGWSR
eukprot:2235129-Rhodomonas_salina.8